jgi:predicted DNA-binding transcriptional regulator AlpA
MVVNNEKTMSENNPPMLLGQALLDAIRQAVREAIQGVHVQNGDYIEDRLLDAEEAAKLLCVSEDWLYRNAKKLPFTRKLGPKMLRFSHQGIQKYLSARKV